MKQRTRSKLQILTAAVPAGAVVGIVYDLFQGWPVSVAAAGGGVAGGLIAGTLVSVQLSGWPAAVRHRLRRRPTIVYVTGTFLSALALVLGAFAVGSLTANLAAPGSVSASYAFDPAGVVFALAVAAVFVAVTSLDRIVGTDVLVGIFTGRYLTPIQEHRVFLLADLAGSTALAERIGDLAFHRYLDDLFSALAECVARNGGQIYRYVGDAMIVSWRADRRPDRAAVRALACVEECRRTLSRQAAEFDRTFGRRPYVRFVLHAGPVVTGKMGEIKRDIVFLGDTVNTTARLEEMAKLAPSGIVASGGFVEALGSQAAGFETRRLSRSQVRGKLQPVEVFELLDPGTEQTTP